MDDPPVTTNITSSACLDYTWLDLDDQHLAGQKKRFIEVRAAFGEHHRFEDDFFKIGKEYCEFVNQKAGAQIMSISNRYVAFTEDRAMTSLIERSSGARQIADSRESRGRAKIMFPPKSPNSVSRIEGTMFHFGRAEEKHDINKRNEYPWRYERKVLRKTSYFPAQN